MSPDVLEKSLEWDISMPVQLGKIKPKQWDPNGRNDLVLDRDNDQEYEDAIFIPDK